MNCPERLVISISWVGFLGVAVAVTVYLVIRLLRRRRPGELEGIKKKLRELK